MNRNKKWVLTLAGLLVLVAAFFVINWFYGGDSIHKATAQIIEVKDGSIIVEAFIGQNQTVEFQLTNETVLNKSIAVITEEQLKADDPFTPERRIVGGAISDLIVGKNIVIYSKENLVRSKKATATRIDYVGGLDYPENSGFKDSY